jgi:hypothetical protein
LFGAGAGTASKAKAKDAEVKQPVEAVVGQALTVNVCVATDRVGSALTEKLVAAGTVEAVGFGRPMFVNVPVSTWSSK